MSFFINVAAGQESKLIAMYPSTSWPDNHGFSMADLYKYSIARVGRFQIPNKRTLNGEGWWFFSNIRQGIVFLDLLHEHAGEPKEFFDRPGRILELYGARLANGEMETVSNTIEKLQGGTLHDGNRYLGFSLPRSPVSWKKVNV